MDRYSKGKSRTFGVPPYINTLPRHHYKDLEWSVTRLALDKKLPVHSGCVNTVCWSYNGRYLLSGSDDRKLAITSPFCSEDESHSFVSGHRANIFSAKFMPNSDDLKIVSAAGDGRINLTDLGLAGGSADADSIRSFACHRATVFDVVTSPSEASVFLSVSADGTLRQFDLREPESGHTVLLSNQHCRYYGYTAAAVHPLANQRLFAADKDGYIGEYDRRYIGYGRWVSQSKPAEVLSSKRLVRVTSLSFDPSASRLLASYNGGTLYLFDIRRTVPYSRLPPAPNAGEDPLHGAAAAAAVSAASSAAEESGRIIFRFRGDWSDTGPASEPPAAAGGGASDYSERLGQFMMRAYQLNRQRNPPPAPPAEDAPAAAGAADPPLERPSNSGPASGREASPNRSREQPILRDASSDPGQARSPSDFQAVAAAVEASGPENSRSPVHPVNLGSQAGVSGPDNSRSPVHLANLDSQAEASGPGEPRVPVRLSDFGSLAEASEPDNSRSPVHLADLGSQAELSGPENSPPPLHLANLDSQAEASGPREPRVPVRLSDFGSLAEASGPDNSRSPVHLANLDSQAEASEPGEPRVPVRLSDFGSQAETSEPGEPRAHGRLSDSGSQAEVPTDYPSYPVCRVFQGHRNARTCIQQAAFWGTGHVISGSDCGHFLVWRASDGRLLKACLADQRVVNRVAPHPSLLYLATSGIDYDVKLWSPTSEAAPDQEQAEELAELVQRNQSMLAQTMNTVTVPGSAMLSIMRMLSRLYSRDAQ